MINELEPRLQNALCAIDGCADTQKDSAKIAATIDGRAVMQTLSKHR